MAIGKNVTLNDRVIKKTEVNKDKTSKTIDKNNAYSINKENLTNKIYKKNNVTDDTIKMTFYIKENTYQELRNFAYWDRHSITEAFNMVIVDGLKGKVVKKIKN